MAKKLRLTLPDETAERLERHVATTGRTENDVLVAAVAVYLAACESVAETLVQNGPVTRSKMDQAPQVVEPEAVTPAPRNPYKGALPTDTDEILALVSDFNAIDLASHVDTDLWSVYATRKQEIGRTIERERAKLTLTRP